MIERLRIRNFAVAREVTVNLSPGLTVFTGETGAGKSLVVGAIAFAFGARGGRELVAPGAERATVEVTGNFAGAPGTIERSVGLGGRSQARIDGAIATVDDLRRIAEEAVDVHGQSGQLQLLRPAIQLATLDAFGGLAGTRDALAETVRRFRSVSRRLESLTSGLRERERLIDRLQYEVEEIRAASLVPDEDEHLRAEQQRLAGAADLQLAGAEALEGLDESGIPAVAAALARLSARDDSAGHLGDLGLLLESTSEDLRRELRSYIETIEEDPERLAALSERLDLIARLRRKYGDSVEAILAYAAEAEEELEGLTGADASVDSLQAEVAVLARDAALGAQQLSLARREAARSLIQRTMAELESLGMAGATFEVGFETRDDPGGIEVRLADYEVIGEDAAPSGESPEPALRAFTESGVDRVEYLVSFNPGMPPRPLSSVASGGETSRFLLALTAVFSDTSQPRTIVLDEVDEGVGGRAGSVVGEALARLARRHQVLCITHLPQVAAFAERHYVVRKRVEGGETWSKIEPVEGAARIDELAMMLGGLSEENRAAAQALLGVGV